MLAERLSRSTGKGDLRYGRGEDYWACLMPDVELLYSPSQVKKAGKILRSYTPDAVLPLRPLQWALEVFTNWRDRHSVPLSHFYDSLQAYAQTQRPSINVVHRPKRVDAVVKKLQRDPSAQLSTMQDIAGCRAVVNSIDEIYPFAAACKQMWSQHTLREPPYDYIEKPNPKTGYRGIHLVFKYHSDNRVFDGMLIEVQIRTREQHAWATAVETFDLIERQSLKSGQGSPEWQRFFTLMSSAIAHREFSPFVPNTPQDQFTLADELRKCSNALQVKRRLMTYGAIARTLSPRYSGISGYSGFSGEFGFFVIDLDVESETVEIRGYDEDDPHRAYQDVINAERQGRNVVLAAARDLEQLKEAYPNWFVDTRNFLMLLNYALGLDIFTEV